MRILTGSLFCGTGKRPSVLSYLQEYHCERACSRETVGEAKQTAVRPVRKVQNQKGEDEDAEQEPQTEPETGKVTELPEETEILSEEALDAALEETEGQKDCG